jgi:diazepam-binding inhibitor (GABA receptor modulator, acyl-CoA-binding protein)
MYSSSFSSSIFPNAILIFISKLTSVQNRDRLELYALHKQAISGDAPNSFPSDSSVAEKARYQAWKSKRGISTNEAMASYVAECDRQIRVYGSASPPPTPNTTPNNSNDMNNSSASAAPHLTHDSVPRGIAAIPLLCAAVAESRIAYLRRLSRTNTNAWWSRQEPLCGTPGTITSLPEALLLSVATLVEQISLSNNLLPLPQNIVQSFFWPLHNISLASWILLILILTTTSSAITLGTTLLLGTRRTGRTLIGIWLEEIQPAAAAVQVLCGTHQPISVRLQGLWLLPYTTLVQGLCIGTIQPLAGPLMTSVVYIFLMGATWWYWFLVIPIIQAGTYVMAFWSGFCFALIEVAGI